MTYDTKACRRELEDILKLVLEDHEHGDECVALTECDCAKEALHKALEAIEISGYTKCAECKKTTKPSPCPGCAKTFCQYCAEMPYAFCCDGTKPDVIE